MVIMSRSPSFSRYLEALLRKDLGKKMVFLGGPRQCGKTHLGKRLLGTVPGAYLNWDSDDDRQKILSKQWNADAPVVVLDELHKFHRWKNWIKGIYDTRKGAQTFLVTGSARLDVYKKGGDSLLGRYHYWRLHPFTLSEHPPEFTPSQAFERLMRVGGFPEPFLHGDETEAKRWRRERFDRVIREDLRDLEPIKNIAALELFVRALRERVGSQVVLSNIAADLQVAPKTLKHWLEILERMYLVFVVRPYTKGLGRALQKSPKVFFFDNGDVLGDEGARFENLVATSLLKELHFLEDSTGDRYELHYIRDKEKREVDFAITRDGSPIALIEAKWGDATPSENLRYYAGRLGLTAVHQIVGRMEHPIQSGVVRISPATSGLSAEGLRQILVP